MKPREPFISVILILFLAVLWLGFLFHQDEHFAGSFSGGILAVSGALFLLVPLLYSIIKRVPILRKAVTQKISFPVMLEIHIYAGFTGAILVLLHTGHKFHGTLATFLTALLLIDVLSGYTGRYLLSRVSKEVVEKKQLLTSLNSQYEKKLAEFQHESQEKSFIAHFTGFFSRYFAKSFIREGVTEVARTSDVFNLAESIADMEYAISTHDLFKRLFSVWLKVHIALSLLFYLFLALHVGGEYYFGLRWFQ